MLDNLWEGKSYTLKPFNKNTISIVEEKLQLKLPVDYIRLMKEQNGGRLARNLYKGENGQEIMVDELLGISEDDGQGILTTIYMREEWDLPEDIILLSGDGHSWVFLDYRGDKDQASVSYIDLETEEDYMIARNFTEFMNGLYAGGSIEKDGGAEGVYSEEEFEGIVEAADDAFALTDGVLYFSEIDCDMKWLIKQVTKILNIHGEESEFVLPEVLDYLMRAIETDPLDNEAHQALQLLANKIESHPLIEVQIYYTEIIKGIR